MEKEIHPTPAEKNKYDFQAGKAYMLIGGNTEDIVTSCDGCGGPYYGQCQGACPHCEKERKVFYADVTDVKLIEKLGPERMKDTTSFILPNNDTIKVGAESFMVEAVAHKILVGYNGGSNLLVGNQIGAEKYGKFDTVVISDDGKGVFKDEAQIRTLAVGKNVSLTFGYNCKVGQLLTMGNVNIETGEYFYQGNRKNATYSDIAQIISKYLNS